MRVGNLACDVLNLGLIDCRAVAKQAAELIEGISCISFASVVFCIKPLGVEALRVARTQFAPWQQVVHVARHEIIGRGKACSSVRLWG